MAVPNPQAGVSRSEILRRYMAKWPAEEVISIYTDAFPDEKDTLTKIRGQYGSTSTLDMLRESLTERVELPPTVEREFPPAVPRLDIKAPIIPEAETEPEWMERTLTGLRDQGYTPQQIEQIMPVIRGTEVPEPPPEPVTGPIEIIPGAKRPKHPDKYDVVGGLSTFFYGLTLLPKQTAARMVTSMQGWRGASAVDKGWGDRLVESAAIDAEKLVKQAEGRYKDKRFLPGISIADVANLPQNLSYSGTALGAGLGVGAPVAMLPVPGARAAGFAAGTAAAGAVAFNMASYEIMQEYLEAKNEEMQQRKNRQLTLAEEKRLKSEFANKARRYGAWEAIPEALGGAAGVGIMLSPLTKIAGRSVAARIVAKLGAIYGEELVTETITEMGQRGVRAEAALPGGREVDWTSPSDWLSALKDIAPQTFLVTTVMAGAGGAAIRARAEISGLRGATKEKQAQVAVDQLAQEIGRDDPDFHNFVEKIEAVGPDTALDFGALPEMPEGVVPAGRPAEQMPIAIPELEPEVPVEEAAPAVEPVPIAEPEPAVEPAEEAPVEQPPPGAYEEEAAGKTEPEFMDDGPPVGMSIREVVPPEIEIVKEPKDLVGWKSHLLDWMVPRRLFIPIFKENPAVSRVIHMARDTLDRMSGEMRHYADRIDQAFKPLKRKEWKELIALLETPGRPEGMSPRFEQAYNAVDAIRKEALDMIQNEMGIDISEWGMSPEEYWPHIFVGSYQIVTQAAGAEAGAAWKTIDGGFSKSLREAVDKAQAFLQINPDANIRIQPRQMRNDYDATLLTRKGFFRFLGEVEKATELDKSEIMSMLKGVAAIKPRGKFVGNFMQRQSNLGGYVEEPFALKVYMNRVLRKKWLDPFRKEATNLAATMPPGLRGFFGEYIDDVSGKYDPRDKNFKMSATAAKITRAQAWMKLGVRPVTAMLNRLQPMQLAFPEIGHYLWRGNLYKRTAGGKELLEKSGIYGQAPKYAASEASFRAKPTEKIYHPLGLFRKAEMANREDVIVGGYLFAQKVFELPRSKAMSRGYDYILEYLDSYEDPREAALEYAKDLNADVNFIYNAADLPKMFRSKTGRVVFQFRTYPINFLATTMKWTLQKPNNPHYWARLGRLVGTNVILGGVRSVPYIGRNLWKALVLAPLLFPMFSDQEKKARRVLLRGMFTQLGIDLSRRLGPNEFIPNDMRQLLGPFANDLFVLYQYAWGDIERRDLMRLIPAVKDFYVGITASHGIKDPNKRMRKVLEVSGWQKVLQSAGAPLEKVQVVKDLEFLRKEMQRELIKQRTRYVDRIIAKASKGQDFSKDLAEAVELGIGRQEIAEEVAKKYTPELLRGLAVTATPLKGEVADIFNKVNKIYDLIETAPIKKKE